MVGGFASFRSRPESDVGPTCLVDRTAGRVTVNFRRESESGVGASFITGLEMRDKLQN